MTRRIFKTLITILLTLIILILIKSSSSFKEKFYLNVYDKSISFAKINNLYKKYISKEESILETQTVSKENTSYNKIEKYKDGAKLYVDKNTIVKAEESGIVVFIGEKEDYGNTIIIQRIDGIDQWYCNVSNINVKLYDYIRAGSVIAEDNDFFYLVYKKNGKVLNYEEYIK